MLEFLQFCVILLAVIATVYPLTLAVYFFMWKSKLGLAMSVMLFGESIGMAAVLYFAFNSYAHTYNVLSPWASLTVRYIIIFAALYSSIHLTRFIIKRMSGGRFI